MRDRIWTASLLFLLGACSAETSSNDSGTVPPAADATPAADANLAPDAAEEDAGEDAGADVGVAEDAAPPDAGMAEACTRNDAGRCVAVTWTSTTGTYPMVVDHHTAFITEGAAHTYLTVAGGIRTDAQGGAEEVYSAVRRAEIATDGSLGAWTVTSTLPIPLAFHAMTVANNRVYLLAGVTSDAQGPAASIAAIWGEIDATGTIAEWKSGPQLPREARLHASAQVINGRLYLIGGTAGQTVTAHVNYTELDPATGAPTTWVDGPPLPAPRSHHVTLHYGPYIYVLAGFDETEAASPAILRSTIDNDGSISGWEQVGEMMDAPWTASGFVHRNYVYLVGGGIGSGFFARFTNIVRFAPVMPDFSIGPFEEADEHLPLARSHVHHTPVFNDRVYSVGGRTQTGRLTSIDNVFIGELW